MEASALKALMTGEIAGIVLTEKFLLFAAISLEIPFLMILLSRICPYKINRRLNVLAPVLMIIYQVGSMFVGSAPTLHYMFFSTVEVLGNLAIFFIAITWKKEQVL